MQKELLLKFNKLITERLNQVEEEIASSKKYLVEISQAQTCYLQDLLDHSQEQSEIRKQIELHKRKTLYRSQLQVAFARIKLGTYGHCADCGEGISLKRLEVVPRAVLCADCMPSNGELIQFRSNQKSDKTEVAA